MLIKVYLCPAYSNIWDTDQEARYCFDPTPEWQCEHCDSTYENYEDAALCCAPEEAEEEEEEEEEEEDTEE